MELRQLKARLDLLDAMVDKLDASPARVQSIKRTVFVLRSFIANNQEIPSVYTTDFAIARFSFQ